MANDDDHTLLVRIDERTTDIERRIGGIEKTLEGLKSRFVTKEEFDPVKRIVYGVVGVMGMSIVTGLIALLVKFGGS